MTTLARSERAALSTLFDELGPDAATLCGDWTTRDLAAHLVVRERRPDALPGIVVKGLAGHTESVQNSYSEGDYTTLVDQVRTGPGRLSPLSLPGLDKLMNTAEYAVHHEDVRRAQPSWEPRALDPKVQDTLWKALRARAPISYKGLDCGVEIRRTDRPDADPLTPSKGTGNAVISGEPLELLLYAFGRRDQARVKITGDPAAIDELRGADLAV